MPVPSAKPAASSVSSIAGSVPKTSSSTTPAAAKPSGRPVDGLEGLPSSATWPSAANVTPLPEAAWIIVS